MVLHLTRILLLSVVFFADSCFARMPADVQEYWQPTVDLAGNGNQQVAVKNLNEFVKFQQALSNSVYSPGAQDYVDGIWLSFEDFDFNRFYHFLPEQQGDWRRLQVFGENLVTGYEIMTFDGLVDVAVDGDNLGDALFDVKVKPIKKTGLETSLADIFSADSPSYAVALDYHFGMGNVTHQGFKEGLDKVIAIAAPQQVKKQKRDVETEASAYYWRKAQRRNPRLAAEDLKIVAPIWQSYPNFGDWLFSFGSVENVIHSTGDTHESDFRHVYLSIALEPNRFRTAYPDFADYFDNMDKALKFSLAVNDENGRLFGVSLDTKTLKMDLEVLVSDKGIVPVKDGRVLLEHARLPSEEQINLHANIDAVIKVHGIIFNIDGIGSDVIISQKDNASNIDIYTNSVPDITVDGYAFGVVPTDVANIFIPKTIDQLMREFFVVACNSRENQSGQQGIHFNSKLQENTEDQQSYFRFLAELEAKNSILIRFIMAELNDRLIVDKKASEEFSKLLLTAQDAFDRDLQYYASSIDQ